MKENLKGVGYYRRELESQGIAHLEGLMEKARKRKDARTYSILFKVLGGDPQLPPDIDLRNKGEDILIEDGDALCFLLPKEIQEIENTLNGVSLQGYKDVVVGGLIQDGILKIRVGGKLVDSARVSSSDLEDCLKNSKDYFGL